MQDVKLVPDEQGLYDISIENNEIAGIDGFQSTIVTSLFTDARAPSSIVPNTHLRRGWIGDILTSATGKVTGSTLWLLDQARMISSTFSQAELYVIDALQHLIDNDNARNVTVEISPSQRQIDIEIAIDTGNNETQRYNTLWRLTNASGISNI